MKQSTLDFVPQPADVIALFRLRILTLILIVTLIRLRIPASKYLAVRQQSLRNTDSATNY